MRKLLRSMGLIGLLALAVPALAAQDAPVPGNSPVGTWRQVDDHTGKVTSILEITEHDGELRARVLKVLNQTPEQIKRDGKPPICTRCKGERHNQPIEGMRIMWGVHQDGDEWNGGHILDPASGDVYKVKLELAEHGSRLKVRGYIGISLFGRTQVWQRMATPPAPAASTAKPAKPATPIMPATSSPAPAQPASTRP